MKIRRQLQAGFQGMKSWDLLPGQQHPWSLRKQLAFWIHLVFWVAVAIVLLFFQNQPAADFTILLLLALALLQELTSKKIEIGYLSSAYWMLVCGVGCLIYFLRGDDLLGIGYAVMTIGFGCGMFFTWRKSRVIGKRLKAQLDRVSVPLRKVFDRDS